MATLRLNQLRPGMVLAADVRDRSGRLLLKADVALTEARLTILKTWGIGQVEIHGEPAGEPPAATSTVTVSAANLKRAGEMMDQRFRLTDRSHRAIDTLYRYCVDHCARQLEIRGS